MSYVERILQPGETVLATGRLHWVILLPSILVMVLALAIAVWARAAILDSGQARIAYVLAGVLMVFGVLTFLGRLIVRWATEFAVTNRRVIVKRGLVSLHTVEMNEDKVESVDVDQTILGRLLGYGTVTIHGVGARWDPIDRIADPMKFRSAITTR
jgi:uncharacterized membrane protein YdbT with pleckstrin-like domain